MDQNSNLGYPRIGWRGRVSTLRSEHFVNGHRHIHILAVMLIFWKARTTPLHVELERERPQQRVRLEKKLLRGQVKKNGRRGEKDKRKRTRKNWRLSRWTV